MPKWNNEYNPNEISKKLTEIIIRKTDGTINFHALPYTEYISVLESMITFESDIPEWEKSIIIQTSINSLVQKETITPQNLLTEINKTTKKFLSLPKKSFVLVSSLSIVQDENLLPKIKWDKYSITPQPILNKKYLAGINHLKELTFINSEKKNPPNYMLIKIHTDGRTVNEAFDKGINVLDLLRGVWNLAFNRSQNIRISFGKEEPINKIRLGLIHSLHLTNGELATDIGWYDLNFAAAKPLDITPHIDRLTQFTESTLQKIKKCSYRTEIEGAIILYVRALDLQDMNSAFLKLWSVLERLTGAEDTYSSTIRRTSFVFQDKEYYRQVLRHLKDYRNRFVHRAFNSNDIEIYTFQLKECVEAMINFHLGNHFGFKSIKEATEFLDLPTDKKILEHQVNIRHHAQKYLRHIK